MDSHVYDLSGFLPIIKVAGLPLPVYFLITTLSFIVGLLFLVSRAERLGFSRDRTLDVSLVIMISGFIGSRLFHVIVEEPNYYLAKPFLVFDIWRGGFVWYGGALLAAACGVWFLKWKNEDIPPWLDLFAPVGALGYAIGRTACFATGCCFGKVITLPHWLGLSEIVPGYTQETLVRVPTQLFAVLFELCVFFALLRIEKMRRHREAPLWFREPGQLFFAWLVFHGLGRVVMESFRADPRGPELSGLSVATWLSLALIVISSWFFIRFARASRLRD